MLNDKSFNKVKVKFALEQATKAQRGGKRYSSTLSLTSAVNEVGGQRHAPATLPPGERPGTHCVGGVGGPQGRSGRIQKILPPPAFDPQTVQLLASRYTDWAVPA
jgi:hypothetical protein